MNKLATLLLLSILIGNYTSAQTNSPWKWQNPKPQGNPLSQVQVVGIDARPHVAAMADEQALRDPPIPGGPGGAVRQVCPPGMGDHTVAAVVAGRGPENAAGFGVAHAVVVEALLQRAISGRSRGGHRVLTLMLSPVNITGVPRNHLLWSLEVQHDPAELGRR